MNCKCLAVFVLLAATWTASAEGKVIQVGPTRYYTMISSAYYAASSGDVIEIDSGTYYQLSAWVYVNGKHNLTFRGVGPTRPVLDSGGACFLGKGIFVIEIGTNNTTIENLELENAKGSPASGIRGQGTGLTVRNCYIHDCDDGILTDAHGSVTIEGCEFYNNGDYTGQTHNMYIGAGDSFTLQNSYSHGALVGHQVKTRARKNYILNNLISDDYGWGSYEVDIPQGGTSYVIGNSIFQVGWNNQTMVTYQEEPPHNAEQHLYVVNNTLVSTYYSGTIFVNNASTTPALVQNNIFQGTGTAVKGPATSLNNLATSSAYLANLSTQDYRLTSGSTAAIDQGSLPDPATGIDGTSLIQTVQYKHPCSFESRPVSGTIDIGAYELGTANQRPTVDAGADQLIESPGSATLAGTAGDDGLPNPPGALTYNWTVLSGPSGSTATLDNPSALSTTARFDVGGTYVLQLQASDGVLSTTDTVTIQYDQPPVADAGADQTVAMPGSAALNGSASDDGLPNPPGALNYAWTKVSGPGEVTFADASEAVTKASFSETGIYVLQLAASDGANTSTSTTTVTVKPPPTVQIDAPPTLVYDHWPVTLTCSAGDPNGYVLTYKWTQTGGAPVSLSDDTTSSVSFVAPLTGNVRDANITLQVTVTNDKGGSASDTVSVFVYMLGDINQDYDVNIADLKLLVSAWNSTPNSGNWNAAADLDNSASVTLGDLKVLMANWNRAMLP